MIYTNREESPSSIWGRGGLSLINVWPLGRIPINVLTRREFPLSLFTLGGALVAESIWAAFIPAGLYLAIHLIEAEAVIPILLAKRFTLNPVLVWDAPGATLSVPMLAVTKIVCDRAPSRGLWTFPGRLREKARQPQANA
jgi:hypothetical protein